MSKIVAHLYTKLALTIIYHTARYDSQHTIFCYAQKMCKKIFTKKHTFVRINFFLVFFTF